MKADYFTKIHCRNKAALIRGPMEALRDPIDNPQKVL